MYASATLNIIFSHKQWCFWEESEFCLFWNNMISVGFEMNASRLGILSKKSNII